jgi:hypothetical protein
MFQRVKDKMKSLSSPARLQKGFGQNFSLSEPDQQILKVVDELRALSTVVSSELKTQVANNETTINRLESKVGELEILIQALAARSNWFKHQAN